MTTESEKTIQEMMVAHGDSLSHSASFNDGEDGEEENDEEVLRGQLSEDDEPDWVMSIITNMVKQCMEMFPPKQMKIDKLIQPGLEDAADYFRERDTHCATSEMRVPAVVQLQTDDDAVTLAPTTFGGLMECLNNIPRR
jgi:hypothetical protein